jgi:hypothetical protein
MFILFAQMIGNRYERVQEQASSNAGVYQLVDTEKQVMDVTTSHPKVVVHFAHRDFKRCRIMDKHLQVFLLRGFYWFPSICFQRRRDASPNKLSLVSPNSFTLNSFNSWLKYRRWQSFILRQGS